MEFPSRCGALAGLGLFWLQLAAPLGAALAPRSVDAGGVEVVPAAPVAWRAALPTPAAADHPPDGVHLALRSSSPAKDAVVDGWPDVLSLEFTEDVDPALSRVVLVVAGTEYGLASRAERPGAEVLVYEIPEGLPAGSVEVRWSTTGDDGHPVSGSFAFTVRAVQAAGAPAETAAPVGPPAGVGGRLEVGGRAEADGRTDAAGPQEERDPLQSPSQVALRAVFYASLIGLLGGALFFTRVVPSAGWRDGEEQLRNESAARTWRALRIAALLAVLATGLRLLAQQAVLRELLGEITLADVLDTTWGRGWLWQTAGITAAGVVVWLVRASASSARAVALITFLGVALVVPLTGHAAGEGSVVGVLNDAVHVAAAAAWIGGLAFLLAFARPVAGAPDDDPRRALRRLLPSFSRVALVVAPLTVLTGVVNYLLHGAGLAALLVDPYGRVVTGKTALVAVVLALGAWHNRRIEPGVAGGEDPARLVPSGSLELGVALVVVIVTSVLVATPPME
ncbi:MAG: hypothetical protein D6701_02565 [Gemmatimonadetes bacterium]|nr:MAG: hypothetical protein D6701_02565 [Gemmatimonadota bacterium]